MTVALLDDHLLRDLLAGDPGAELAELLGDHEPATTNHYLYRLCKSVVAASGGALTGSWPAARRQELGRRLLALPNGVRVVPMRQLAYRMAEIATTGRLSTLGAEAVAAAQDLNAPLCVWQGDDGPAIRLAFISTGMEYRTLNR